MGFLKKNTCSRKSRGKKYIYYNFIYAILMPTSILRYAYHFEYGEQFNYGNLNKKITDQEFVLEIFCL